MSKQRTSTPLSELARAALLGAEREAVPVPAPDSPLAPFWDQLQEAAPEYQLLSLAGVSSLYQQAGSLPPRAVNTSSPQAPQAQKLPTQAAASDNEISEDESTVGRIAPDAVTPDAVPPGGSHSRPCSTEAGHLLISLFDGTHRTLLPELLQMMAEAQLTVPNEYLPNILSYGVTQTALRRTILAVTGAKGRELASHNPKWVFASPQQLTWDAALHRWRIIKTSAGRQTYLRQLRSHNPELGRRLLETTWKSEEPAARVSLMRGIEMGLSMADEPFLEAALDDRNNAVRKKAVDLLSTLPQSRHGKRMANNTADLLEWIAQTVENEEVDDQEDTSKKKSDKKSGDKKSGDKQEARITVHFPDEISADLQRDGVLKRNVKDESRRRRLELLDMISTVPLDTWTERWQVSPTEVIQAAQRSRWPRTLTQAFVQAAERQRHTASAPGWIDALLSSADFRLPVTKLIGLLSPEKFDALIDRVDPGVDAENPFNKSHPLVISVRRWAPHWSESLSLRWLERLEAQMPLDAEATSLDSLVRTATKQFATKCARSTVDEAIMRFEAILESCPEAWQPTIEQSLATLRMRKRMREVIGDC